MRPCNQCGKAVENDLDYCDHCSSSSSSSSSSKDVLGTNRTATPVSVPADDDTIAAHDNRFFRNRLCRDARHDNPDLLSSVRLPTMALAICDFRMSCDWLHATGFRDPGHDLKTIDNHPMYPSRGA